MKKEIRKENKITRMLKRLRRGKSQKQEKIMKNKSGLVPRKIRRNRTRSLIKKDGITKVNKALSFYWKDVQAGAYKI